MEILSVTIPIFIFLAVGYLGKKKDIIKDASRDFINKLVYYLALPALIVRSILSFDFSSTFDLPLVAHNLLITTLVCIVTFFAAFLIADPRKRGSFNMGSFRTNQGYIGLPLILGFYGMDAMSKAAVIGGFELPLVIFLSVVILEVFNRGKHLDIRVKSGDRIKAILTNPLFLAAFLSLVLSYFDVRLLKISILDEFLKLAGYLALPLALLSIGASLKLSKLKAYSGIVAITAIVKLAVMPAAAYLFAYHVFGFRGEDLGISVILLSAPTSVSSYVMAAELDADKELMAAIIGTTTFLSIVTITVIRFLLK